MLSLISTEQRVLLRAARLQPALARHFTVDGTLVEAWASVKSFRKKDEKKRPPPDDPKNPTVDFRGEKRGNATHESTTDPEALLARSRDLQHPARARIARSPPHEQLRMSAG